jgi:hypothetical protein
MGRKQRPVSSGKRKGRGVELQMEILPALLMSFILGGMALWTGVSHLTSINLPPTVDWYVANLFDFTIPYNLMWIFVFLADFFRPAAWIGMGIVLCLVVLMPVALLISAGRPSRG